jgi:hypothetical protein
MVAAVLIATRMSVPIQKRSRLMRPSVDRKRSTRFIV